MRSVRVSVRPSFRPSFRPSVLPSVRPSVRPSFRPSVRSLPRYLRIALMDFDEILRKVQFYARLERNIFGFLKNCFFGRILGKKWAKKSPIFFFHQSLIFFQFLKICMLRGVLGCFGQKIIFLGEKWVKTGLKAGHRKFFEHFSKKFSFLSIFENIYIQCHIGGPMIHLLVFVCLHTLISQSITNWALTLIFK